jgi:hypothetical protein
MMGFGFLLMLLLIVIPLVGIVVLAIWLYNANRQGTPLSQNPSPEKREQAGSPETKRLCSHCGAGLQEEWIHCPQCGAPAGS